MGQKYASLRSVQSQNHDAHVEGVSENSSIFDAIKNDDLAAVKEITTNDYSVLYKTNDDGAYPVHSAYLCQNFRIGRYLVEKFPREATLVYTETKQGDTVFTGENILHLVIVHQRFEEFDWLLSRHPDLLDNETVGSFFEPSKGAYFGGFPLLFAVSTNKSAMVERILTSGVRSPNAQLTCTDRFGNNALHMAVVHDLPDMYDFILDMEQQSDSHPYGRLGEQLNSDVLTPFALAAAMGNVRMFQKILSREMKLSWMYGPTKQMLIPLRGFEQPHLQYPEWEGGNLQVSPNPLVFDCIAGGSREPFTNCLKQNKRGHLAHDIEKEVLSGRRRIAGLLEVKLLVDAKWDSFGRQRFLLRFVPLLIALLLWLISITIPYSYSLDSNNLTAFPVNNGFILTFESLVALFVIVCIILELIRIFRTRANYLRCLRGMIEVGFYLMVLFYLLTVTLIPLKITGQTYAVNTVASFAVIAGWTYLLYLMVAFEISGSFIINFHTMFFHDIPRFALVFTVVLVAFNNAVHLVRPEGSDVLVLQYFKNLRDMILQGTVGEFKFKDDLDTNPSTGWFYSVIVCAYIILQFIILMAMLIALLSKTYSDIVEEAQLRFYIERINMMRFLEDDLSIPSMYWERCKYAKRKDGKTVEDDDDDFNIDLYHAVVLHEKDWVLGIDQEKFKLEEKQVRDDIFKEEEGIRQRYQKAFDGTLAISRLRTRHRPGTASTAEMTPSRSNSRQRVHAADPASNVDPDAVPGYLENQTLPRPRVHAPNRQVSWGARGEDAAQEQ